MSASFSAVTLVHTVPRLRPRQPEGHKGTYGRVLVVAGSRGMSGAAVLCASAALRGGAGLVRLAVPAEVLPIVAASNPCYTTAALPQDEQGRLGAPAVPVVLELVGGNSAVALGPGLGQSPEISTLVRDVLEQTSAPLVLDADALNVLVHQQGSLGRHAGPVILTPHPGEFARLTGLDPATIHAERRERAVRYAATHGVILVLKGHGTVVTDGKQVFINPTGNPGMATGGSGDVLTGLLAALLGQGLEPFVAAQLGVYLHGLAGDLARDHLGEASLIASDLLQYLPAAFRHHAGGAP
jgi:ADP-dependent NAD(P)H-hydrate dehydratase